MEKGHEANDLKPILGELLQICKGKEVDALRLLLGVQKDVQRTGDINEHERRQVQAWEYAKSIREEREFVEEQLKDLGDKKVKGLSDWANQWLKTYDPSLGVITKCSVLGGSIAFLSITSAIRGDISYMCYAFLLFMLGFAISIGIKLPLNWYCYGPNMPLKNPRVWEGIIAVLFLGGGASVSLAFVLLAVCIQVMSRDPKMDPTETISPLGAVYTGYGVLSILVTISAVFFITFIIWRLTSHGSQHRQGRFILFFLVRPRNDSTM